MKQSKERGLTAQQQAQAERIFAALKAQAEGELWEMAQLLASKEDRQLLGETEFQVRDLAHRIGGQAVQTALEERKKRGTSGAVASAPAEPTPGSSPGVRKP
jgi:hypothetical protein